MTITTAPETNEVTRPTSPGEWSLAKTEQVLSRPLPGSMLRVKEFKGNKLTYIPWYIANKILSKYSPGWEFRIAKVETTDSVVILVGELSLQCSDGTFTRQATGMESLTNNDYGEAVTKAESQAFRRCATRFGLGLTLYDHK